jgi:membrane protein
MATHSYALLALAAAAGRALFAPEPRGSEHFRDRLAPPITKPSAELRAKPEPLRHPNAWWLLFRDTASAWMAHKAGKLGAALAYYSIFSLGPLLVIVIAVAGLVFGVEAVRGEVTAGLAGLMGDEGAEGVETLLVNAGEPKQGILATILGAATLIFAAVGVGVQLKDALNTIWNVKPAPSSGIWGFVRSYAVSLAGVLALGFLTTALSAMGDVLSAYLPEAVFHILSFVISFAVITALFAAMFKWLPDAEIAWRDVLPGAVLLCSRLAGF